MSISPIRYYIVSLSQCNYIQSITNGLSKADYKLFCHIFASTLTYYRQCKQNNNGWLPIPKWFIRDKFRNTEPNNLKSCGLIDIDRQYIPGRQSRQYRIKDNVLESYIKASRPDDSVRVNLVTGKPFKDMDESEDEEETAANTVRLIQGAIQRIKTCYFNRENVLQHLKQLAYESECFLTKANRFRYQNDWFCFDAINKISFPSDIPGIYTFKPKYTPQSTGRIGTPMQSCSRAMKAAAYGNIPNVFNYDLTSSQMVLSLDEMQKRNIECRWLEEYLKDRSKRDKYAQNIGISVDAWKECLCTVIMTGHIPTNVAWKDSPIVETLREALRGEVSEDEIDDEVIKNALNRLRTVLKPLLKPLKTWHKQVEQETIQAGSVTNILGITRQYKDFRGNSKSGIVAHLLQGMEAYFIHTLTLLADKYGFEPIGNEHDGLITLGEIPAAAIEEAKALTGLHQLELRRKPFQ